MKASVLVLFALASIVLFACSDNKGPSPGPASTNAPPSSPSTSSSSPSDGPKTASNGSGAAGDGGVKGDAGYFAGGSALPQ